ncbi:GNAT family N-acetyltransferase [Flammeovirga sp. SubArs3]|uniref:GNAT family N-acetyltransferase n=1 Tax=Flammeovirga sp. SubArs3 TaxID=2995316 RepID=UPI00248D1B22|nr:GNAT family N-acetyltransferase [Flammeovirga sp. SubArs3]
MNLSNRNFKNHANYFPSNNALMRVLNTDSLTYIDSGFKSDTYNIIHIHDTDKIVINEVSEAIDFCENRLRKPCVWLDKSDLNDTLSDIFQNLSLEEAGSSIMLELPTLSLVELNEVDKNIFQAKEKQDIIDHAFVIANNWDPFDTEVLHHYNRNVEFILKQDKSILLNYSDGTSTVGVIELFLDPENPKVAGIYNLSVFSDQRKNGIGTKLVEAALYFAKNMNVEQVVTQASEDSLGIFKKFKFNETGIILEFGKK